MLEVIIDMWVQNKDIETVEKNLNVKFGWFSFIVFEEYLVKTNIDYIVTDNGDFYLPNGYKNNIEPTYIFMEVQYGGMARRRYYTERIEFIHNYTCKNAIFIYIHHGEYSGDDPSEHVYIDDHINHMNI